MRVLIVVPRLDLAGGVSNYYRTLRPHLDAEKVYIESGIRAGEAGRLAMIFRLIADYWQFHRALRSGPWDLVHINPSMLVGSMLREGVYLLIARAHRRRVLVFFRGWDHPSAARILGPWRRLFTAVYGQAVAFIVLAAEFQAELERMAMGRPIYLATTVVNDVLIGPEADTTPARDARPGDCNVLYLSRLDSGKGLPEAIETFASIHETSPAVRFTIAGDGPARPAAEADVRSRGLSCVRFLGHVDGAAKAATFRSAEVYFFPSASEGMPNSVLEAMACGLPVVTRPVGGVRDFFEVGRMGFLTETQDPAVYAQLLNRLIGDPGLRLAIGKYNREYARRHFAAPVVVQRLLSIYEEIGTQPHK